MSAKLGTAELRRLEREIEDVDSNEAVRKERRNQKKRAIRLRYSRMYGRHTDDEWWELVGEFDGCCVRCGYEEFLERDHIIPIYQGGLDTIENIQPLCHFCNTSKGPECFDWAAYRRKHGWDEE